MGGAIHHPAGAGRDAYRSVGAGKAVVVSRTRPRVVLDRFGHQHGNDGLVRGRFADPTVAAASRSRAEYGRVVGDRACRWSRIERLGLEMVTPTSRTTRYGPLGFVAALVNILLVNLCLWLFVAGMLGGYEFYVPVILVDLLVAFVLALRRGVSAQIGRGMLIGWLSGPLSLVVFIGLFSIGKAIGI
ncbi:hypothetical protein [Mycolicibacterium sp. J2]|uniref:hypothetical protein n=1 Tax=Mycolicibacterium sp. J2 TaxID=2993511 RepID=UPI00224AA5CB|nr:hypothetical protein [Mycolicibacterium sp. J2]MCX2713768.1 hypothetical protein [Mycolicibacterium sp. J2]